MELRLFLMMMMIRGVIELSFLMNLREWKRRTKTSWLLMLLQMRRRRKEKKSGEDEERSLGGLEHLSRQVSGWILLTLTRWHHDNHRTFDINPLLRLMRLSMI